MRDHHEADQYIQNIPMNKTENLRKTAFTYYYNNHEYCTLQQRLSKPNTRQAKHDYHSQNV